jgi:hypothetical protein
MRHRPQTQATIASAKRLEAMHQAVKTICPAPVKLYDMLGNQQKTRFNTMTLAKG